MTGELVDMTTHDTRTSLPTSSLSEADYLASDPRPALLSAVDLATPVIAAAQRSDLAAPTPCGAFDVATLLAHLNAVLARTVAVPAGRVHEVGDLIPADDYRAAWLETAALVPDAWAGPLDSEVRVPWRGMSLREASGIYAAEIVCHAWDLAVATGQDLEIPEEVADVCVAAYATELPPESRAAIFDELRAQLPPGMTMDEDPFGAAVPVTAEATGVQRVVAMSGRDPLWTAPR